MNIEHEVIKWLHSRPNWQQEIAVRILTANEISDDDYSQIIEYFKTDDGQRITQTRTFPGLSGTNPPCDSLRILSIGDISGIDNLNPKKPLNFGHKNLVVVYGNNGSGKSGYVRIFKKICGKPNTPDLLSNAFGEIPENRSCKIVYHAQDRIEKEWDVNSEHITDLEPIDIFDSFSDKIYLNSEKELSFTPNIISLFEEIVRVCDLIKGRFRSEKDKLSSNFPNIPSEYANAKIVKNFLDLTGNEEDSNLISLFSWENEDQHSYKNITECMQLDNPVDYVNNKRKIKNHLDNLCIEIETIQSMFSPNSCVELSKLKQNANDKRIIASEGIEKAIKLQSLHGLGSQTWRSLWEAAKKYSEEIAYPSIKFPNTSDGSRCVLCQQPLLEEGRSRLIEFNDYIQGQLEIDAIRSEEEYKAKIKEFPEIKNFEDIKIICLATGLDEDIWVTRLSDFWGSISIIKDMITKSDENSIMGIKKEEIIWINELKEYSKTLDFEIHEIERLYQSFELNSLIAQKVELEAKLWMSQQFENIKDEVSRLNKISILNEWIETIDTRPISIKAGELGEKLITQNFIDRFNRELEQLGGKGIKVELVKTRVDHGRILHGIKLLNSSNNSLPPVKILSEGEKRIITMAAFLADVTGRDERFPFIFDDPISSLDQEFEENSIERLIELSNDRQVIIFTHRLSFLGIISDITDDDQLNVICIRKESWGSGEVCEIPLVAKKPDKILKEIKNNRIIQARRILTEKGGDDYYPIGKSLCSDFRNLIEIIVESVLINDVVKRHRRAINTKGKIRNLAKIVPEDCLIIDEMMTKYSRYEHSQSLESPVNIPDPNEIEKDIDLILNWLDEFKKR
ncbi:MAG: AAA family ATPase [Candidatus Cloacimonetes bacterium]|nr:AAA family ATPase [Candidatus Cloacimonadota bacterium]